MAHPTDLRLVKTPKRERASAAVVGWCLLLAALVLVAVLDVEFNPEPSPVILLGSARPAAEGPLCVGDQLEVRMCKVAQDGFILALEY